MTGKRLSAQDRAYWEARSGGHKDARTSVGSCPLMGKKVQLLPLRYGRVERLASTVDAQAYQHLQRPIGLRLIRDGFLYVIEEATATLHEYRIENGVPVKLLWQGKDITQDERTYSTGEATLVFARNSVLHVAYSELQWTAAKCAHVIGSGPDRFYFMQQVDLANADCETGGKHLRVQRQIKQSLAELAEQPAQQCSTPDVAAEENQDYLWEHQALFREAHLGELKDALNPLYQFDHLYLILEDSLGIMRDLAEEQDCVVGWIEEWTQRNNNEMRYVLGSYIDTLMTLSERNALRTEATSDLFKKTTPAQRTPIYDYINARNQWQWENSKGLELKTGADGRYSSRRGADLRERPQTVVAKREMQQKKEHMIDTLGEPLYEDLKDEIEALEDSSEGTLQGVGLGSRGLFDLVRHEEMQSYLKRERLHLKRWTERLDAITHDRTQLFTLGEFHRSAWYFDPNHPEQLNNALATEHNCTRDLCRTDEALEKISGYFHDNPFYLLPVFYGRLDLDFLRAKSAALLKLLDDMRSFKDGLNDAQARISEIGKIMGNHWSKSLQLAPGAHSLHQAVSATYIPAIALGMEKWLAHMQASLETPDIRQQLDSFKTFTNRGQRLGMLVALQQEGATLSIASADDVQKFTDNFTRLNHLLKQEEHLKLERKYYDKIARSRMRRDEDRYQAQAEKQNLSEQLLKTRNERAAIVRQLEQGITPTSTLKAGHVGVRLNISPENLAALNDEINRLKAGLLAGYDTKGARTAALKSGFIPLLAVGLQVGNLGEAWNTLNTKSREGALTAKDKMIFFTTVTSVVASTLAAYQSAHIAMVDKVIQSTVQNNAGRSGTLFAVKSGKLGLSLGIAIAPMAFLGAAGTLIDNWHKWQNAFFIGNSQEKAGALSGLLGDLGSIGVTGTVASKVSLEGWGLRQDYLKALPYERKVALAHSWATRGSRLLHFSIRLTPLSLAFTALQLGGEALYNYNNLDDQQHWMLGCYWGVKSEGWDWPTHSQKLAEATLLPYVMDKGLHRQLSDDEPVRRLHLVLPGVSLATFKAGTLSWTAALQKTPDEWDAGQGLSELIRISAHRPLTLELDIPYQWQGMQAQLQLRLAVRPDIASQYLKHDQGFLHYRIPLSPDRVRSTPVTASKVAPTLNKSLQEIQITRERLDEIK